MSTQDPNIRGARPSLLRNWLSMSGLVIVSGSLFSMLFLFLLELMTGGKNPYVGILMFVVAPAFQSPMPDQVPLLPGLTPVQRTWRVIPERR